MSNEDSNVTGMTQTSSAQNGDENDFVFDFGDENTVDQIKDSGENSEENIDVGSEGQENKNISFEGEMNKDSNQDNLLDENVELQEQKIDEISVDLNNGLDEGDRNQSEFDFSLDDENNGGKSVDFEENDVNDLGNIDEKSDNMEENVENLDGSNENLGSEVNLEDESVKFPDKSLDNNSQDVTDTDNVQIEDLDKLFDDAQTEGKSDGKDSKDLNDGVQSQDSKSEETDFGDLFDDNSEDVKDDKNLQEKKLNDSSNTVQEEDLFTNENSENLDDVQLQDSKEANEVDFDNDFNVEVNDDFDAYNQGELESEGNKESDLDVNKVESVNDDSLGDGGLFQGELGEVDSEKSNGALQEKKVEDNNGLGKIDLSSNNGDVGALNLEVNDEPMEVLDDTQGSEQLLHENDLLQNEKKSEDSDYGVNSKDLENEYVNQPDMMDLLGDDNVDFSGSDTVDQKQGAEMDNPSDVEDESVGLNQLDSDTLDVRSEDKDVNKNEELENVEKTGFVMDLSPDDKSDLKIESDTENGRLDISDNLSETQSQVDLGNTSENVVDQDVSVQEMGDGDDSIKGNSDILNSANIVSQSLSQNQVEDLNKVEEVSKAENIDGNIDVNINQQEGQEIKSTLSLDQIMDSEVNNNLQLVDNSDNRVVSNDSSGSLSLKRKKMVFVAGIGIFLLAGLVFVLAFPSNVFERKPGDVFEGTGDNPVVNEDEWMIDENPEILWHDSSEDSEEKDGWLVSSGGMAGSSIVIPEDDEDSQSGGLQGMEGDIENTGDDIEDVGDVIEENPEPYLGDDLEDEEPVEEEKVVFEKNDIMPIIDNYRSQIEVYRSYGYNELQDKKYIKYTVQAMHLCDVYQQQVENGEGLDEDSLRAFEAEINSLLSNLIQYEGGEEVSVFIQPNFNEEYYFEGKDEVKNYVYERSKTSTKK